MASYGYLSTFDWTRLAKNPGTKKIKKEKPKINIVFSQCIKYIDRDDERWIQILNDASLGKFPRHFKYNTKNNTLLYSRAKYREMLKIPDNLLEAIEKIIDFFRKNGRIYSKKDRTRSNNTNMMITWKNIKSSKKKENLIDTYSYELCKKYKLNIKDYYNGIKTKINTGLLLGQIESSHVQTRGEKIINIDNFKWNQDSGFFYIENKKKPPTQINKNIIKDNRMFSPCTIDNLIRPPINTISMINSYKNQYLGLVKKSFKTVAIDNLIATDDIVSTDIVSTDIVSTDIVSTDIVT